LVAAEQKRVAYNEHRRNLTFQELVHSKEVRRLWALTDKGAASIKETHKKYEASEKGLKRRKEDLLGRKSTSKYKAAKREEDKVHHAHNSKQPGFKEYKKKSNAVSYTKKKEKRYMGQRKLKGGEIKRFWVPGTGTTPTPDPTTTECIDLVSP
jgi:hypothetical protein